MTFARSLQIRRLATQLPVESLVLETDAPDLAPAWLGKPSDASIPVPKVRNEPAELAGIGRALAQLRGVSDQELAQATARNARRVLPRLKGALALDWDRKDTPQYSNH